MIDGRSPWALEPTKAVSLVSQIASVVQDDSRIRIQASSPLQFVPWDLSCEEGLTTKVGGEVLAFAVQKVSEVVALANALPDIVGGKQV